jgi:hypothetical protein
MPVASLSINKYGCHRQVLFLIGQFLKQLFLWSRDVNRFWSSRRKLKSSRQIDADGRGSGINGAKSCIIGLSWHLISLLKLHFFVLFFSYFQQIVQDKRPFFTTFDHRYSGIGSPFFREKRKDWCPLFDW